MTKENMKNVTQILNIIDDAFEGKQFEADDFIVAFSMMMVGSMHKLNFSKEETMDLVSHLFDKWTHVRENLNDNQ
jgi:hypothetical protein